jgi:hypothetical protein
VQKVQINPRTTAKYLVKMLEETGTKVSTVKRVLYQHNLKGRSATAHGDKDGTFWRNVLWSDETKIELFDHNDHLSLEEKGGGLQAEEHHPNREALWRCFDAGGSGVLHKIDGIMRQENDVDILKQHLKTSVKAWSQMDLPNGQ